MKKALDDFRSNIARARNLGLLYQALSGLTTSAVDASDILRAQIVIGVSALDHYVHELTLLGMLEIFGGRRMQTDAFKKFQVSVGAVLDNAGAIPTANWFEAEVRERHGYQAFQKPEKIADAVRLFSNVELWREIGVQLVISDKNAKERLRLIVERRDKIAHEADMDPSYPGVRWPISYNVADDSLNFISNVCEAIQIVTA